MDFKVCEIFMSIQGESTFSGRPCVFVRLSGCNLNCTWCDTVYAKTEYTAMSLETILDRVRSFSCGLVEITGGEPLLQAGTPTLINRLLDLGRTVLLETNGSFSLAGVDPRCVRIMDIKCPLSGESGSNDTGNLDLLTPLDEVKFVLAGETDYEFARTFITGNRLLRLGPGNIHLSPVAGSLTPETLAHWMIRDNINARLSLQLHKLIWDPEKRGV
ncbi:MAG: radical SAM protein [Pseudomonadota bacterium]